MQILINFLFTIFSSVFSYFTKRFGYELAISLMLATLFITLAVGMLTAFNTCFGSGATCDAAISSTNQLSDMVKFGMSLVPSDVGQIFSCLLALHVSGFSAIHIYHLAKLKVGK